MQLTLLQINRKTFIFFRFGLSGEGHRNRSDRFHQRLDSTRLNSTCNGERTPIAIKLHSAQRTPAGTPVDHQ